MEYQAHGWINRVLSVWFEIAVKVCHFMTLVSGAWLYSCEHVVGRAVEFRSHEMHGLQEGEYARVDTS